MDERTLTALQGSIAKWQAIVDGTGTDEGTDNCPLCHEFYYKGAWGCSGCPVEEAGFLMCQESPYSDWIKLFVDHDAIEGKADTPERKQAAQAELDFLKALLPKEGLT